MKRLFAVIPAAGVSRRMGVPKLTLPWGDRLVIDQVLQALDQPAVAARVLVTRADHGALVAAVGRHPGVVLVCPEPPPAEMRHSVEAALQTLAQNSQPAPDDGWLLVPADHPLLDRDTVSRLADAWTTCEAPLLIPTWQGRKGHPVVFRWSLAAEVAQLPADVGLNVLTKKYANAACLLDVPNPGICEDLDTPADLLRLRPPGPPEPA